MRILYVVVLLCFSLILNAQNASLKVIVNTTVKDRIDNANVKLSRYSDSSIITTKQTNKEGFALFAVDTTRKYFVTITSIGYAPIIKIVTITNKNNNIIVELQKKIKAGADVATVVGKKPLIRQEDDKTIVDPENLALSSTNAFEVLEKTPGIFTDQDGNFYLSSTTPATVQINGRDMRLSAVDLASLIKSLPPNSIQRIEIVRTPSAKNDANGSGGVVNIVLKKGVKLGLAGSVFAGFNQGTYGNQYIGASLSNNTDKKTVYAYTGFSKRTNYDELNSTRFFKVDTALQQQSFNKTNAWNPYINFGASVMPNKNWDIGYDANFSYTKNGNDYDNNNTIKKFSTNNAFTNNTNLTNNDGDAVSFFQSVNSKLKVDSNKIEWTNNISHSYYSNNNEQLYSINTVSPIINNSNGNGTANSSRNLVTVQTDVVWKPIKRFTVEAGLKNATLQFQNNTNFSKNGAPDVYRTNRFKYKENIFATYLQAAKTIEKIVIKAGLRLENTFMQGTQQVPTTNSFAIKRNDFFPYAFISRPVVKIMGYDLKAYLVYNKSISRPGYDLLNPFPKFIDNYLSEVGNPNLQPQFSEKFEANISFEDRPVLAFGQNRIKGIFTNVIYQNPANPSEALRTYDNLGNNTENYFQFTAALPPGGKYFFVVGGQRNFNQYRGQYEGKPLNFDNKSWNFFTYHQLKLGKLSTFTLQGWMQTGGLYQFYQLGDFGQLNASINRYFVNKKLVVTLNVRDIFFTNNNDFTLLQGSVNANGSRQSDTRRFGVNIRYNFGIKKKREDGDFTSEAANRN
jgi:iron complex outermembrane recepter protein